MSHKGFRKRAIRALMAISIGGSAFQISGCDPAVRDTLLTGLETTTIDLSSALISAFFLSLDDDDTTGGGLTTS